MELRQLRYFLMVAEHGSILRASRALRVAQPSVTAQITALEHRLGVQLFERRPRGVLLTGEDRELARHARSVVKAVAVMEEAVQQRSREPVGRVVVDVSSSLVEMLTLPLIEEASDKMPLVRITVVEGMSSNILDWIARDRVDLGLAFDTSDAHGVDREPIIDEELFFVSAETILLLMLSAPTARCR